MAERKSSVIRASEIGSYLYCERAWWYARQGVEAENQAEMQGGTALHNQHARTVWSSRFMIGMAYALLLAALVVLVIGFLYR